MPESELDSQHRRSSAAHAAWLVAACALLVAAAAWPLVEYGPQGPTLWRITADHGVDARDLWSIPLLVGALLAARRSRARRE